MTMITALAKPSEIEPNAWRRLCEISPDANIFYGPDFLTSARAHLPSARHMLVATASLDARGARPLALLPVTRSRLMASLWSDPLVAITTPLIDEADACAVGLAAALQAIERQTGSRLVHLPIMRRDGRFHDALAAACGQLGARMTAVSEHRRSALIGTGDPEAFLDAALAHKKRRELRRQRRRLAEEGELTSERLAGGAARDALEEFFALEARGWKGRAGTAARQSPSQARFLETALYGATFAGGCEVFRLAHDGAAIAMGLVLRSGTTAYYYKTAYDETFARYSPGVLLVEDITRALYPDPSIDIVDSCAVAGHAMIEAIWPDKVPIVEILIDLDGNATRLNAMVAALRAKQALKRAVKRLIAPIRGY